VHNTWRALQLTNKFSTLPYQQQEILSKSAVNISFARVIRLALMLI
jgi:hypothetical protein